MPKELHLTKALRKLDKKIADQGYTLEDVSAILQDKNSLVILFFLVIKALIALCLEATDEKHVSRSRSTNGGGYRIPSFYRNCDDARDLFFLSKRFLYGL